MTLYCIDLFWTLYCTPRLLTTSAPIQEAELHAKVPFKRWPQKWVTEWSSFFVSSWPRNIVPSDSPCLAIHCQSLSTMPKEAAAVKKRRRQLRDNSVEHLLRASSIICTRNASFEQNFRSWYPLGRRGGCWARQKDTYHQNSSNILASLSIRAHFGSQIEWCHGRPRAAVDAQGFVAYDSIEGPSFLA